MGNYNWSNGPYLGSINTESAGADHISYPFILIPLSRDVNISSNPRQSERWPYRNLVPGLGDMIQTGGTVTWNMLAYTKPTASTYFTDAEMKQKFFEIPNMFVPNVGIPQGIGGTVNSTYYQATTPGSVCLWFNDPLNPYNTRWEGTPHFTDMDWYSQTFKLTLNLSIMPWEMKEVSFSFNYSSVGAMSSWSYNTSVARGTYNLTQAYYYGVLIGRGPAWDWTMRYNDAANSGTGTVIVAAGGAVLSTYVPYLGTYSQYTGYNTSKAGRIIGAWENQTYRDVYMPLTDGKVRLGSWPNAYHKTRSDEVPTFWTSGEYLDYTANSAQPWQPRQLPLYVGITDDSGPNTGTVNVNLKYKQGIYL